MAITGFFLYFLYILLGIVLVAYIWFYDRYKYWKRRNVPGLKPIFPFGNVKQLITGSLHLGEQFEKLYLETKKKPFIGLFLLYMPTLQINDLDLIKNIMVKDFMHFTDHGMVHNEEAEPLEGHLFNVNGNRWRNLRLKLLPSFTSGKIKTMFNTLALYARDVQRVIDAHVDAGETVDLKELLSRYGTDIVGTCLFGVECKSVVDELSKYRMMVKKSQRLNSFRSIIQNLSLMAPWIVSRLRVSMYQDDVNQFFLEMARDIFNYRKYQNVVGNDYMQTLIKLREERIEHELNGKHVDAETEDDASMSIGDLAAQLFVFFVDGVETSSTTAGFALYELARNPDVQEKLRNEIDDVIRQHDGKLTFETFSDMKYLAQVVDETLRMYPPLPLLFRLCTKDYNIPGTNIVIEKGTNLVIPMLGIHRDPDLYPNPMQFDPDRFSPENKAERHRFAHLPFGEGPRMCMGTRFGPLMTRMGLVTILSRYKITIDSKYVKPFTYLPHSFILVPESGINLNLVKRENPTII